MASLSVAVSIDLLLWMLLTTSDPRHCTSWCHGFVKRDELMARCQLCFEVWLLAGGAEGLSAIFAVFCGLVLLTAFTDHSVRISMTLAHRGSSSSQHGGGKVIHGQGRRSSGGGDFQFKGHSTPRTSQRSLNYYKFKVKFKSSHKKRFGERDFVESLLDLKLCKISSGRKRKRKRKRKLRLLRQVRHAEWSPRVMESLTAHTALFQRRIHSAKKRSKEEAKKKKQRKEVEVKLFWVVSFRFLLLLLLCSFFLSSSLLPLK